MLITRTSMLTKVTSTLELPVTQEQIGAWEDGMLIQQAMPHLNADQREFFMTGITGDEWAETFGGDEAARML